MALAVVSNSVVDAVFSYGMRQMLPPKEKSTQEDLAHPLDRSYEPDLLFNHGNDTKSLPHSAWMFCFPAGYSLAVGDVIPPLRFHGFVSTDGVGLKHYAMVAVYYERLTLLPTQTQSLYADTADKWRTLNITANDLEYIEIIKSRLAMVLTQLDQSDDETRPILVEKANLLKSQMAPFLGYVTPPDHVLVPRCLGLMSRWNFGGFYKDWLKQVIHLNSPTSQVLCFQNLLEVVPLPPCGKQSVLLDIAGVKLHLSRPPLNSIPLIKDYTFAPLLACLGAEQFVRLFEFAVAERKILFVSSRASLLSLACYTLTSMLYPLYWQHLYIPLLPVKMIQYIHAPMPYIMGILSEYADLDRPPSDVLCADLDQGRLTYAASDSHESLYGKTDNKPEAPFLPNRERVKLVGRINKHFAVDIRYKPTVQQWDEYLCQSLWSSTDTTREVELQSKLQAVSDLLQTEYARIMHIVDTIKVKSSVVSQFSPKTSGDKPLPDVPQTVFVDVKSSLDKSLDNAVPLKYDSQSSFYDEIMDTLQAMNSKLQPRSKSVVSVASRTSSRDVQSAEDAKMNQHHQAASAPDATFMSRKSSMSSFGQSPIRALGLGFHGKQHSSFAQLSQWLHVGTSQSSEGESSTLHDYFAVKVDATRLKELPFLQIHELNIVHKPFAVEFPKRAPKLMLMSPVNAVALESPCIAAFTHHLVSLHYAAISEVNLPANVLVAQLPQKLNVGVCDCCTEAIELPFVVLAGHNGRNTKNGPSYTHYSFAKIENTPWICTACKSMLHQDCLPRSLIICSSAANEPCIQDSFLRLWSSQLRHYPQLMQEGSGGEAEIRKQSLLAQINEGNSTEFTTALVATQAYLQFLDERRNASVNDYEVLLFDECVKAKLNRSKLKMGVETTPFISDTKTYAITSVYQCPPPAVDLRMRVGELQLPDKLNLQDLPPVPAKVFLASEQDMYRLKIQTHSILRKDRLEKAVNGAPQIGNWMRERVLKPLLSQSSQLEAIDHPRREHRDIRTIKANINLTVDEAQTLLWQLFEGTASVHDGDPLRKLQQYSNDLQQLLQILKSQTAVVGKNRQGTAEEQDAQAVIRQLNEQILRIKATSVG